MKYSTLALVMALGLASTPALADRGDRSDRFVSPVYAAAHQALEHRDDVLQRRSATFRIGVVERQEITKQRREIKELQDRLEDGKPVDYYALWRVLDGPQHIIYFDSDLS
jgi:1,2-phenylacetyl-CoA epoxidase PaaB subunit